MNEETKKIRKPLFNQMNERYKEVEEEEQEKRKMHIQSIRDLHKPMNHDEILEHGKRMEELTKAE
jgi:hypothetical protein